LIEVSVPGRRTYRFEHLVLDLNGTIAADGEIIEGVAERLHLLGQVLSISIATADTHGSMSRLGAHLHAQIYRVEQGAEDVQKLALVQRLGEETTVAIGNGCNDVSMLKEAALGICVIGEEGAATEALMSSDVVVAGICAALDLLINTDRLAATLRR
jgi:P-type E1-E2 ATPase